ncbi:helix-turn-helix domain-containing protein [Streptomyces mirabilis]|uniref:helix-turn-helix domain-containing protein n=1 Tax=Streptomyces mirabilis TaxID=68239 RepID=UPI0036B4078B
MSGEAPGRRRDAAGSRELLPESRGPPSRRDRHETLRCRAPRSLRATLFAERGFDRTTIRDIGERAGVDPALIARYFGSKTLPARAGVCAGRTRCA